MRFLRRMKRLMQIFFYDWYNSPGLDESFEEARKAKE